MVRGKGGLKATVCDSRSFVFGEGVDYRVKGKGIKGKGVKGGGKGVKGVKGKGRVRTGPLCPYQLDIEQNMELRVLGAQSSVGFGQDNVNVLSRHVKCCKQSVASCCLI